MRFLKSLAHRLLSPHAGSEGGTSATPDNPPAVNLVIDDNRSAPPAAPAQPSDADVQKLLKAERERAAQIREIGEQHNVAEIAERAVAEGTSIADFGTKVLEAIRHKQGEASKVEIGMDDQEIKRYSLVRALQLAAAGKPLDGLEKEASDAVAKRTKADPQGFFVPADAFRDLTVGTATAGGHTVATDLMAGSFIDILRNRTKVIELGAMVMDGLTSNVAIPRQTTAGSAALEGETDANAETDQAFNQLTLSPKRVGAFTEYSKQLLLQSSIGVEAFVRNDLMRAIALKIDEMALNGSGSSNEPTGIINTSGVGAVTFGATATWDKVIEFETDVATANADVENMSYLTTAAVRGAWKGIKKDSGSGIFLWEGAEVNGYRAEVSEQVPSNKVVFGNWADAIIGLFGGLDVVVNPYIKDTENLIRITLNQHFDIGVRQAASFSVSADAGNQ